VADQSTTKKDEEKIIAKIRDLFQKINEADNVSNQRLLLEIEDAEINFKEGYHGEAYLQLTSVIDFQLYRLWRIFVQNSTGKLKQFERMLDLKTYAEILWHVEYISESQRSDLKAFQKGRNTLAHYTSKHLQAGHPSDENLDDQFKKGLSISKELTKILEKKSPKYTT